MRIGLAGARRIKCERVLGRQQPRIGKEWNEAERFPSSGARNLPHPIGEQRRVAAKLVDQETADQRRIGWIDDGLGADQARNHPAAVDVADQHDRARGRAREPHVGNVVAAQVHFRCAAGTLDQDEIGFDP